MSARHATLTVYRNEEIAWSKKRSALVPSVRWRWRFLATNGKETSVGSESYNRRAWCLHGAAVTLAIDPARVEDLRPGEEKIIRRGKHDRVLVKVEAADA